MKLTVVPPPPLCTLLRMSESSALPKEILDCGAGGVVPPLSVFADYGYRCHGIDISPERVAMARCFADDNDLVLDIQEGDMRELSLADESFSFVYSINTIFHMSKADTAQALREMQRVLRRDGILYVNFLSIDDDGYGEGVENAPGEFAQEEEGQQVVHSYYADNEPDSLFPGFQIVMKVKRSIEALHQGHVNHMVYLDYYARRLPE
jgi:ubiquinone/menaquinone biosynthesis C-methylase UbiE